MQLGWMILSDPAEEVVESALLQGQAAAAALRNLASVSKDGVSNQLVRSDGIRSD